jgi:prepilin-type N-terminal cleavage/methylation domain-containing protein
MKKFGFSLVELLVVVAIVSMLSVLCQAAEVTSPTTFRDRVMFRGSTGPDFDADNKFSIGGTKVTASASELSIMDGVTATAAQIDSAAVPASAMTTATVTNGAALTLSAATPNVVVTSRGGADGTTNTITIATPYPVGSVFRLIAAGANTNLILIADSTTVMALGADALLGATDTLVIFTSATNAASKLSTSDN